MRLTVTAILACLVVPAVLAAAPSSPVTSADITRAMQDPARAADRTNDQRRQMAAILTFTGIKPGDDVLELVPGSGYWTRVFSRIVGSKGHVYTVWPDEMMKYSEKSFAKWQALVKTPHYANVTLLRQPAAKLSVPAKVDLVFTADNYHDYHDAFMGPVDMAAFDKKVYDSLKPDGVFVVVDHRAPAGSGARDTNTLHRIDPAAVKQEVESAGFKLAGTSNALQNPDDPLDISVFDKSIRGQTSQFILKFRKPVQE